MTINCRGKLIDLSHPRVMGILNVTPDSFFDGGQYQQISHAVVQAQKMLDEGASFIDLGAYSSRPGAANIPIEEEKARLLPVIKELVHTFPNIILSVDTFRAGVAKMAIEGGAAIVNDISASILDEQMMPTVGGLQVPYIMMHMRGTPQTMKTMTSYDNITKEMLQYFSKRVALARKFKINDLILDPGFGFAKTQTQNFKILKDLSLFNVLELPILAGVSRKSMIYKTLNVQPKDALNGTTALHMAALLNGAKILRTHDVKEAIETIQLFKKLQ